MKFNHSLLLVIFIFAFNSSCKKDNSDLYSEYSQADPIISGIENTSAQQTEEPVGKINEEGITELSKSDSISEAQTAFVKNSDGKYQYKFHLEKGKIYPLNTTIINTETTTFRGKTMKNTTTSTEDLDFKVVQVQNGNYVIEATFKKSRMVISGNGQSVTVDPNNAKPSEPMLQPGWMVQKARIGKTITFQMDDEGNITNVRGFDKILADLKKQFQSVMSGEQLNAAYQMASQQINGESFKNQVEAGMIKFPKGGAELGQSWTEKSGKGSLTFTLTKIENGVAEVKVNSNYPSQSDQQSQEGITVKMSASMNTNGKVLLDVKSGWIYAGDLTDKITQKEVASNGQETQTTTVNSKTVTKINQ